MNPNLSGPDAQALRRRLLYAAVATAAGLAGAGLAWWKWRPDAIGDDALAAMWPLSFETPDGSKLVMQTLRGKPLVINFWATWCPPCVDELPLLDEFYRQNSGNGWEVVGLAIDQPSAVRSFLERTPVRFPVGLAGFDGTELAKALGNLAGGLPFTVVVSGSGQVLQRRMGRVTPADLVRWRRLQ
jgi:thiol-disulfide isomerase/thioredoxin